MYKPYKTFDFGFESKEFGRDLRLFLLHHLDLFFQLLRIIAYAMLIVRHELIIENFDSSITCLSSIFQDFVSLFEFLL
jgi:hypothetical protein